MSISPSTSLVPVNGKWVDCNDGGGLERDAVGRRMGEVGRKCIFTFQF